MNEEKGDINAAFVAAVHTASKPLKALEAVALKQLDDEQQLRPALQAKREALVNELPINFSEVDSIDAQLDVVAKHLELIRARHKLVLNDIKRLYTPQKHVIAIGRVVQEMSRIGDEVRAYEILNKLPEGVRRKGLQGYINSAQNHSKRLLTEMELVGLPITKTEKAVAEFHQGVAESFADIFPEMVPVEENIEPAAA